MNVSSGGTTTTRIRAISNQAIDLSRKTNLVSRTWSRGRGLLLRRFADRSFRWIRRDGLIALSLLGLISLFLPPLAFDLGEGREGLIFGLVVGGISSVALARRFRSGLRSLAQTPRRLTRAELELLLCGSLLVWTVVLQTGGDLSPLRPLLFLMMALYLPWHGAWAGALIVGITLCGELVLAMQSGRLASDPYGLAAEGLFVVIFALVYDLSVSVLVKRARSAARVGLDRYIEELERRAREYRLIISHDGPGADVEEDREKWMMGSVAQLEGAVRGALQIARTALKAHTAAVLLLSPDGKRLRLVEQVSAAPQDLAEDSMLAGEGLPGVVLHRGAPVRLCGDFRGAVYDLGKEKPKAFLGVPLLEHWPGRKEALPRGVLIVDRKEASPFCDEDEELLTTLAREILRSMVAERVMGSIRKEKDEKSRFFRAIERLNLLSKPAEICEQVVTLAREVAPLDFVAVTLCKNEPGVDVGSGGPTSAHRHKVVEAVGPGAEGLRGASFEDNSGLVANVVRLGSALPGRDFHEMGKTIVFDDRLRLQGLSSLKVLPMTVGEEVVGTLVCGAAARGILTQEAQRMLGVLAIQAAGSIARARLFERTEELATTDGLTRLVNHRRFQETFDGALSSARRYDRCVSLLMTDIDHFKSVNDTYGHPVGDLVLRGVADLLRAQARDTDTCARYGGEEFVVILPETDTEGARVIADRIRQSVEAQVFQSELGPIKVTLSVGVATFPGHAVEKAQLIDLCDKALYTAKRSGRNQVVVAPLPRGSQGRAPSTPAG